MHRPKSSRAARLGACEIPEPIAELIAAVERHFTSAEPITKALLEDYEVTHANRPRAPVIRRPAITA
jgi:hypothetical protein